MGRNLMINAVLLLIACCMLNSAFSAPVGSVPGFETGKNYNILRLQRIPFE